MKPVLKFICKPFALKALFVLSVFSFNLLMGHARSTIAAWTFFSIIFVLCLSARKITSDTEGRNPFRRSFHEELAHRRKVTYGSRNIYSFDQRQNMRGY